MLSYPFQKILFISEDSYSSTIKLSCVYFCAVIISLKEKIGFQPQCRTKYLEQRKEIQKILVSIYFCVVFNHHCEGLISVREIKDYFMSPPKFDASLILPNFSRSYLQDLISGDLFFQYYISCVGTKSPPATNIR